MPLFKYQTHVTPGPFGTTTGMVQTSNFDLIEVAVLDGWHYVFALEGVTVPKQPPEIQWQPAELDAEALARLKEVSPAYQAIGDGIQRRIRERYSADREASFARLGVAAALGLHELTEEEKQEFKDYNTYVEEVRQWGRSERARFGLHEGPV